MIYAWFSCGGASAVATKLAIESDPETCPVYCDVLSSEHPDNARFLKDCETWFGKPIKIIKSKKYQSVDEVFEKTKFMSGPKGARCTTEMKKIPRLELAQADDFHVFGFTFDEVKRIDDFIERNPDLKCIWNLRDKRISKQDCLSMLSRAGIALPVAYAQGFSHNNCIGCVKSQSPNYWNLVRKLYPEIFNRRAEQSRSLNCRLVMVSGVRVFLDELSPDLQEDFFEKISCGPDCASP